MQYSLQVFQTEDRIEFRTININGEPWFVLADLCRALSIGNPSDVAGRLDDDEKGVAQIDTPRGGSQSMRIVNESGLYSVILRSDKPEAKRFKKWVTSEVLPTIRRTGSYSHRGGSPAFIRRFNANWDRVTPGYFSITNEVAVRLYGRLEQVGHILANVAPDEKEIQPDGSIGSLFSKHLKSDYPHIADNYSLYWHLARKKRKYKRDNIRIRCCRFF